MTNQKLTQWLKQILETQENELGCDAVQMALPSFVDHLVSAEQYFSKRSQASIQQHFSQCPDCNETFEALLAVVEAEAVGEMPSAEELLQELDSHPHAHGLEDTAVPDPEAVPYAAD